MDEWIVLDNQETLAETPEKGRAPTRRGWLPLLLVGLLLLVGAASTLAQKHRERSARLRADLLAAVVAESRAQAYGQRDQIERLVDPQAPKAWQQRYRSLFIARTLGEWFPYWSWGPPAVHPVLHTAALDAGGQRALVEVEWNGRSQWHEQRAYRLVAGRWRRTPLAPGVEGDGEDWQRHTLPLGRDELPPGWTAHHTGHFFIRGPAEAVRALTEPGPYHVDLEGLQRYLTATWPTRGATEARQIALDVQPRELEAFFLSGNGPSHAAINSPDLMLPRPAWPLARATQYRLALSSLVTQMLLASTVHVWDEELFFMLFLYDVEARRWVLSPAEQRAMRNYWREQLGSQWLSPFGADRRRFEGDDGQRWFLSINLLLEQLVEEGFVESPAALARLLTERPLSELPAVLSQREGLSVAEFEARLEQYALTRE